VEFSRKILWNLLSFVPFSLRVKTRSAFGERTSLYAISRASQHKSGFVKQ